MIEPLPLSSMPAVMHEPRAVEQDIDIAAEGSFPDRHIVSHVEHESLQRRQLSFVQLIEQSLVDIGRQHPCAFGGHRQRRGAANALTGRSHQRRLTS